MYVLTPGTRVPYWSADIQGPQGCFEVSFVDANTVGIREPQLYVYLADFYDVRQLWSAYCKGAVSRSSFNMEHATYVISIIHWLEESGPSR